MKIFCGLQNNALLQRDENNFCKCFFKAQVKGVVKCSLGKVEKKEDGYLLTGIKVGGPYKITLSDDESKICLTVWVGDLWLFGGQSNMEGLAEETNLFLF